MTKKKYETYKKTDVADAFLSSKVPFSVLNILIFSKSLFQNLHSLCIDSIRAMCVYSQCVADTQECGVVVLWKFPNTQQQFLLSVGGVFVRNIERLGLE